MVKFVTPPSGHSVCATPSPEYRPTASKAVPKVAPLNFGDPDYDDIDYEAMLQPAHDFDNVSVLIGINNMSVMHDF